MTADAEAVRPETPTAAGLTAVDVVILSWGRVDETCAAIDSALGQRGVEVRLVVVDQGTEAADFGRLATFCSERQGVALIRNEENAGVPGGRNQGAAEGTAQFIVALDNDAEFATPDELAKAVARFVALPRIGAMGFRIRLFSQEADDASSWSYPKPLSSAATPFLAERFVGAGHMIRRTAFEAAGGYDPTLMFMHEESELAYKIINQGFKIVYDPEVVIRHKVSAERRVTWSGKRYLFNVRNRIYLGSKFNFNAASTLLTVTIEIVDGLRRGYWGGVLRGTAAGIGLLPQALWRRWTDPRVRLTPEAKAYLREALGATDLSFADRARRRLSFAMRRATQK